MITVDVGQRPIREVHEELKAAYDFADLQEFLDGLAEHFRNVLVAVTLADRELIEAYCGGDPSQSDFGRMIIYKAMCDLLWTLWGLIQHADDNPAEDFWAYAIGRFERCKALMATAEFGDHVTAVRNNS